MRDHATTVFAVNKTAKTAIEELYAELLIGYLPKRFPTMFQVQNGRLENLVTGIDYPAKAAGNDHITLLKMLGENVEDDFFFMCPGVNGDFQLQAFAACFPNGFLASAKPGMSIRAIHQSLPGYEERIARSVDRYFSRMKPDDFFNRMNVSLDFDDHLLALGVLPREHPSCYQSRS